MSILYRTTTGSATEQQQQQSTFSCWVKRSKLGVNQNIMDWHMNSGDYHFNIVFQTDDTFQLQDRDNGVVRLNIATTRKFRDINSWYHIMVNLATNQSTQSNRVKIYINGVQETSFATATYPSQDTALQINKVVENCRIGGDSDGGNLFGGSLSALYWVAGSSGQYAGTIPISTFGETDTDTGEWRPKDNPSISAYGDNGFFMKFENSGNIDLDSSSNNYTFTAAGTAVTQTQDCPSNVFCTLNPLARGDLTNNAILSNGNTYYSSDQTGYNIRVGTIGANKGKWYWEGKFISHNPQTSPGMPLGIIADNIPIGTNIAGGQAPYYYAYNYDGSNGTVTYNSNDTNYGTTILNTVGQIGMVALDLDNNKVYFGVNGTWTNSGNPSNGTNGYSIIDPADTSLGFYLPAVSDRSSVREYVYAWNFGNGYFGTTAVASAGTNASSNGIFEYDVPTGYTALSTKGLNL